MKSLLAPDPANPTLDRRLYRELADIGVACASMSSLGTLAQVEGDAALGLLLSRSRSFQRAVAAASPRIAQRPGSPVSVWPGVWVMALPQIRRGRPAMSEGALPIVLLASRAFVESDQFRLACDQCELDATTYAHRLAPALMTDAGEAVRCARLVAALVADERQLHKDRFELEHMGQQLSEAYEELSLLYKLSASITLDQPAEGFLEEICREMVEVTSLHWLAGWLSPLTSAEASGDSVVAGETPDGANEPGDTGTLALAGAPPSAEALRRVGAALMDDPRFEEGARVILLDDAPADPFASLDAVELLVVPIISGGRRYGVLFGAAGDHTPPISSVDAKLCTATANALAVHLQNSELFRDVQAMFVGSLTALTSAIDAKDSYTHGHSERVAALARMLATGAGLDPHQVERVHLSGLVHDVGKIGVPEGVLCKPGDLTAAEFELIKLHPEIGAHILQDIPQMRDLIPGVLHHHERWDGAGYPHGLAGDRIPLFGRIIGLADAFDAMSSNRTYRKAMPHATVLEEIHACRGVQFDPDLADVFVTLDFDPFYQLIQKHQRHDEERRARLTR